MNLLRCSKVLRWLERMPVDLATSTTITVREGNASFFSNHAAAN